MTRILFVSEAGDSVCTDVRANIPAKGLRALGHDVDVCSVLFENVDGKLYGYDHVTEKQLPRPSVLVVRHTRGPEGEHWDSCEMYEKARKNGQRIFFDLDDDVWNLPPWNPATEWVTPEVTELMVRNINACDGLFVPTAALAEEAERHVNVPVHVMPAGVDWQAYPRARSEERMPLRLAWFGSLKWRRPDFEIVHEALRDTLVDRYGRVEFWHVGWEKEPDIRSIVDDGLPVEMVEYPWVPVSLLPWALTQVDCAFLPNPNDPFSHARSNSIALRMCAAGVMWAATQTQEYQNLWNLGAGYLVAENEGWDQALTMLVDPAYEEFRRQGRNSGLAVSRQFAPERIAEQYVKVFES